MTKQDYSQIDIRDAFFDEIYRLATRDKDIVFISADADAFSLRKFKHDFPDRFINVGVAEQNMVTLATGLALSGKRVFIYAIIPFITLRCFEHIKVDICSLNLPITIIGAGAGLSFSYDGPTHHGTHDLAVMRTLPELTILNPSDSKLGQMSARIAYQTRGPVYIRLDKGTFPKFYQTNDFFKKGFKILRPISKVNIVSTGYMTKVAVEAVDQLRKEFKEVGVIDLFRIKPIKHNLLIQTLKPSRQLITIEENSVVGGVGTILSEILADYQLFTPLKRIALPDQQYFQYGTREWLHKQYGLDNTSLISYLLNILK